MPRPPLRQLPQFGSTDWAAQQFYRVLTEEERIAAERERLRALGWRPARPADGSGEQSSYSDLIEHDLAFRDALDAEARRRVGERPDGSGNTVGAGPNGSVPDFVGGGRFGVPVPGPTQLNSDLFQHSAYTHTPGRPIPTVGPRGDTQAGPRVGTGALTLLNALAAWLSGSPDETEEEEKRLQGYRPRYGGLGDEMALRRWQLTGQRGDLGGLEYGRPGHWEYTPEADAEEAEGGVLDSLAGAAGDAADFVATVLAEAGIFQNSKGDDETQEKVDVIANKILEACRKYGLIGEHTHGGPDKKENFYRNPATGRVGSRRADGTIKFDDGRFILDYNTAHMWRSDPTVPVKHERAAAAAIRELQRLRWKNELFRMDVFPKSQRFNPDEWERRVDEQIDRLCREIAKELGRDVEIDGK